MADDGENGGVAWWKRHGRTFAYSALGVGIAVFAAGALTGARSFAYGTLLTLATIAFLPFVIIVGLLGLTLAILVLGAGAAALSGGDVAVDGIDAPVDGIEAAARLVPGYYRLLGKVRHPAAFGAVAGALLAVVGLWIVMLMTVVPKEVETREQLLAAKAAIEEVYQRDGRFPEPPASGLLPGGELGVDNHDGFGTPMVYEVSGRWKLQSYEIRSLGADGEPSDDDMCIRGESNLKRLADSALEAVLSRALGEDATFEDDLASLEALRC